MSFKIATMSFFLIVEGREGGGGGYWFKMCKGLVGGDARCDLFSALGVAGVAVFLFVCLFLLFWAMGERAAVWRRLQPLT